VLSSEVEMMDIKKLNKYSGAIFGGGDDGY